MAPGGGKEANIPLKRGCCQRGTQYVIRDAKRQFRMVGRRLVAKIIRRFRADMIFPSPNGGTRPYFLFEPNDFFPVTIP
jgi:hypothetical protein